MSRPAAKAFVLLVLFSLAVGACTADVPLGWTRAPTPAPGIGGGGDDDDDGGTLTPVPSPTGTIFVGPGDIVLPNQCFEVTGVVGSTLSVTGASGIFAVDDLAFLLRVQDFAITDTGLPLPGTPISAMNAGAFAVRLVAATGAADITLDSPPPAAFSGSGRTQVCTMPNVVSVTVESTGVLQAADWAAPAGSGGVVALRTESLVVNGLIDVRGHGFAGGQINSDDAMQNGTTTANLPCFQPGSAPFIGAGKGEGVAGSFGMCGRAFFATGGGGGNPPRAGGGGGGNGGQGGLAAPNATMPQNPCAYGSSCGEGGRKVSLTGQLTMGGGGGAGQHDSSVTDLTGVGGKGGGVIYIETGSLSGNGLIRADGMPGGSTISMGAGGGGAGGSIWIESDTAITFTGTISARGGAGGSVGTGTNCNTGPYGVGGPGAGGRVHLDPGAGTATVDLAAGVLGNFNGTCGGSNLNGNAGSAAEAGEPF